jgi:MFS family permease
MEQKKKSKLTFAEGTFPSVEEIQNPNLNLEINNKQNDDSIAKNSNKSISLKKNRISNTEEFNKSRNIISEVSDYNIQVEKDKEINTNPNLGEGTDYAHNRGKVNRIFFFFLLANIFLNYDTGVIPASLLEIIKEIDLDFKEQALIGSLVYLGLSFASLFVSLIFQRYGPAKVCAVVLILNTLCCFIFSFSKMKYVLFACRFAMGISEAFIVIYGPVWVNNYSPPEHSAKWMGILHSCSALGVMVGYLVAGITINFLSDYLSWRFSIQVQGVAQIPIALYFWFEDEKYINVDTNAVCTSENLDESVIDNDIQTPHSKNIENNRNIIPPDQKSQISLREGPSLNTPSKKDLFRNDGLNNHNLNLTSAQRSIHRKAHLSNRQLTRMDTIQTSNLSRYCSQAIVVLTNSIYISVTLGLCSMFFIVTGVQFWMTSYLIDILGNNPVHVVIIFSAVSITAPLAGVIIGGTFADKYGGYKGKNTLKALKLCIAFGVVAFVFAFPLGLLTSLIYITVLLWTFLFFGAAIVPVGTGIMVSSVRK